jgi:hypothetical protein
MGNIKLEEIGAYTSINYDKLVDLAMNKLFYTYIKNPTEEYQIKNLVRQAHSFARFAMKQHLTEYSKRENIYE